jgi:hypothetical protein
MYTKERHEEAVRAIADILGIPEEVNAKLYDLLYALELINVQRTDVTCLAKCANGGTCQRHIAKVGAVKGLLGVLRVVFDSTIYGDALEAELRARFKLLLCTNTHGHNSESQLRECVGSRMHAVY